MKKIIELLKRIFNNPFGFALCSSIITMFAGILIFRPFFEEGDDLGIAMIAEGVYGSRDYHLVYSNVILGKICTGLYSIAPTVRWHMVIQYIFIFLALILITFILAHYQYGKGISVVIEMACLYEVLVSVQFTKTATFTGIVSLVVLLDFLVRMGGTSEKLRRHFNSASNVIILIIDVIIMIYSMMLRTDAFLISMAVAMILGGVAVLAGGRKAFLKRCFVMAGSVALIFVIFGALKIVDSAMYSDDDWKYYKYYNDSRKNMNDFHLDALDYTAHAQELTALGVSENDAYMYATWQFADEKVVTTQLMDDITSITKHRKVNIDVLKAFVANVYNTIFVFSPTTIALIVLCAALLLKSKFLSLSSLAVWLEILFFACCMFYYQFSGRWSHRVVYASMIAMVIGLAFCLATYGAEYFEYSTLLPAGNKSFADMKAKKISDEGTLLNVLVFLMAVMVFSQRLGNEFEYQEYLRDSKNFAVLQMYMEEEKDTLFVVDTYTTSGKYKYNVFAALPEGALDNCVNCGSWLTGTPIAKNLVEKYGYFDPFDALKRGGEDVILIDNLYPDRKAVFLSEHGEGPRFAAEFIENVCGYNLYHIR